MKLLILLLLAAVTFSCARTRESTSRPLVSTYAQSTATLPPAPPVAPKSNTAIVISQHANLRKDDNASATVLQTVPQDSAVEVIKQQGAWFLVKTETNQGWMHGITIRLQNFNIEPQLKPKSPKSIPKSSEDVSESEDDSAANNYRSPATRDYITGPRGGCYYINSNGNKTYVDRSMCGGSQPSYTKTPATSSDNGYVRGPRGGCYYITGNGRKQYVDRSLCN